MPARFICSLLAAGIVAAPLLAQQPPVRQIAGPPTAASASFARINDIHEFPDGRVLVVDHPGLAVYLVDFLRGRVEPVGRTGAGPGEYRLPERLLRLPDDSVGIWDAANSRFLVLGPTGAPAGFRDPTGRPIGTSNPVAAIPPARVGDRRGFFYGLGRLTSGPAVGRSSESEWHPILRWAVGIQHPDTVALLPYTVLPGARRITTGYATPLSAIPPFAAGAVWAVSLEGALAIVHPEPYRVKLVTRDGRRTVGPAIAYPRVPVSEEHRRAYLEEWRRPVPVQVFRRGESGSEIRIQPRGRRSGSVRWPSHLPPFLSGAARFAPDGTLWVERTTPAEAPPRFDLFDASGRVRLQVELPTAGMRLVGFGSGTVYLVRLDTEGEERLERWRLP